MNALHAAVLSNQLTRYADQIGVFLELLDSDYKLDDRERKIIRDACMISIKNLKEAANEIHDNNRHQ